jgi:phenylacetate-CoA ligase
MSETYDALPVFAQNLACTLAGYWRARDRHSSAFFDGLARLNETAFAPPDELHRLQWKRLELLVRRAREHVPYYRGIPPPSRAPDALQAIRETLSGIPILNKTAYRDHVPELVARDVPARRIYRGRTSGTTGTALPLFYSAATLTEEYATVWRLRGARGVRPRDRHFTFGGQVIVPVSSTTPPFWRSNAYGRQTLFSIYHMTPRNLDAYVEAIHSCEARYVDGYPSALFLVARAMLEAGRPLEKGRLKAVFASSESLLAYQRETIESAFGTAVWDRYGSSEFAVSMTACSEQNLHVDMEFCIVEVEPQEETDEYVTGSLIVTGLANDVTPFLRYRIGDTGTRLKSACPCGRPGDVFLDVDGRNEDFVMTPDGRLVGRLDHIFKAQLHVVEAQILQETRDSIEVVFVPDYDFDSKREKDLLHEIRTRLGQEIQVRLTPVEWIPREPNGKFRAVKSKIGSEVLGGEVSRIESSETIL